MPRKPTWKIPDDVEQLLENGDGYWEDERWYPFLLSASSDTEYEGVVIPVAWQLEFDPYVEELAEANELLKELGYVPDGDGWGEFILEGIGRADPKLAKKLHLDCESSTCVIWVESEDNFRKLVESTWHLVYQ